MTHQLFSDAALKCFENFLQVDRATAHLRPRGAVDAVSSDLRRALARDQTPKFTKSPPPAMSSTRDAKRMGRDMTPEEMQAKIKYYERALKSGQLSPKEHEAFLQALSELQKRDQGQAGEAEDDGGQPDPGSIRAAVDCIREAMGDEAAAEFVSALHQKWPGVYGEWNGEGEDSDLDDQPPYEATLGTGAKLVEDDPPSFRGMPRTGGSIVGDASLSYAQRFPQAMRLGSLPDYDQPVSSQCAYSNDGSRRDGSPRTATARGSKSAGRHGGRAMALDAAINERSGVLEEGYFAVFPDAARIKCL